MLLTKTAEYALRLMALLARNHREGAPLSSRDLATEAHVPTAYVSKILRKLVVHGLLNAEKGHGGGFSLARAPSKIRFEDIFAALGEGFHSTECAFGWGSCNSQKTLHASPALGRTESAPRKVGAHLNAR